MSYASLRSVQGLGWESESDAAWHYMLQVNDAVDALDADYKAQTAPGAPPNMINQAFIAAWHSFLNDPPNDQGPSSPLPGGVCLPGQIGLPGFCWPPLSPQVLADQFPTGWRAWFRDHSSLYERLVHNDAIMKRTGEYKRRFIELYDQFHALGGKPTEPKPEPGYVTTVDRESAEKPFAEDLFWWLKVGGIGLALVYLAPMVVPPVIDAVQKTYRSVKRKKR